VNDTTDTPDHEALFATASAQAGYFTTSQAQACGFSSALLTHHAKNGRFLRVARGLYRLRDYPHETNEEIVAAWRRQAPDAVVSHESALALLGLSDVIADAVHLTVPRIRRRLVTQPGVVIHTTTRPLADADVVSRKGVRVIGPERTIVDVAEVGIAPDQVVAAVHTALDRSLTTPSRLREAARTRGRRVQRLLDEALTDHEGKRNQPRLVLLCGLPASGKTTLARELAESYGAVRLNPDEWELALGIDPFDGEFQVKLEAEFSRLTERLITLGTSVILEWGFWARSERDEKRELGRSLSASVELRFLDVPYDELVRRVVDRHAEGGLAITESHMEQYRGIFQPPTDDELALYDPPM
jgi:predicted kinase